MADQFTVIYDTSRLSYPNWAEIWWVFNAETQKGYAITASSTAHSEAWKLNNGDMFLLRLDYWRTIEGWTGG